MVLNHENCGNALHLPASSERIYSPFIWKKWGNTGLPVKLMGKKAREGLVRVDFKGRRGKTLSSHTSNQHLTSKYRHFTHAEITTGPAPRRNKTSDKSPLSAWTPPGATWSLKKISQLSPTFKTYFLNIYWARVSTSFILSERQWREQPSQRFMEGRKAICFSM